MRISNRTFAILLAGLFLLAVILCGVLWLTNRGGTEVVISVNGTEYGSFPLRKDKTITIESVEGGWYNILEIKDGKASVIESNCSNQICVFTPPLSEDLPGVIICLPHGMVAELRK